MELALWFIIMIVIGAFICEYVDSTLGMGYGTTLTPSLLLVGFSPMQIVPFEKYISIVKVIELKGAKTCYCHRNPRSSLVRRP